MAIKIISGVLFPTSGERSLGSAQINLSTGKLVAGSGARWDEVTIIGSGQFVGTPCKHVSLRHITLAQPEPKASFNLNDDFVLERGEVSGMTVSWEATPREEGEEQNSEIIEISVLIIGEAK